MQSANKFKLILTLVFGVFILIGFLAFATYKSKGSANSNVTVSIWGTMSSLSFNDFISKFSTDTHTDLKLVYTQKDTSQIYSDTLEGIASGHAPDVVLIPQELMKSYSDKIYPIPVSTIPTRTFEDTFVQEASIYERPDGFFGIPFFIDPLVMYWNKDIFFGAGIANPPKTWAEIPLIAAKLSASDANANITKSAVSFGEYSNVSNAKALISALIMQAGNPIVATDVNGKLQSVLHQGLLVTPTVSALNFYTEYSNPKKSDYSWNRSLPVSKQAFLSGSAPAGLCHFSGVGAR